jgi:beta-lactamase superfamily II metal-dependent hydrolase
MHLTAFQSGKGDCLLLSNAADTHRVLVDGGMPDAYSAHVAPALGRLRELRKKIDLVYISHIDEDHIGGILQLLDDEVAWRVHAHQIAHGNPGHRPPDAPRPPAIKAIWHNAFHEQVGDNAGAIEDALAAAAPVLSGADIDKLREAGVAQADLASSVRQAIQVSRRIGVNQLNIPLNAPAQRKLMMLRTGQAPIIVGGMTFTILGPTAAHLTKLRTDWNTWLRASTRALAAIREAARVDEDRLQTGDVAAIMRMLQLQAESFGNPESVTPPNLASLTLLAEQGARSVLLTGDARGDQIVDGLRAAGRLTGPTFRVDVLKVPHHGSENNIDSDFCDAVIARDYVFCGNGEHLNPDLRVVEMMGRRRTNVGGTFKFWFTSSEAVSERADAAAHMKQVADVVAQLERNSRGKMTSKFLTTGSSLKIR